MTEATGPVIASLGRSSYRRYAVRIAHAGESYNRGVSLPEDGKNPQLAARKSRQGKSRDYFLKLLLVNFDGPVRPDNEMGSGDFLFDGPLRSDALVDGFRGPPSLGEAKTLCGGRAGHAEDMLELAGSAGLEEERDDDHRAAMSLRTPGGDLIQPALANAGMEDGFELLALLRIGKDGFGDFDSAQLACLVDNFGAEGGDNLLESRLAGFDELAGQVIGIDNREAMASEDGCGGGFAHAHATGEAENCHWGKRNGKLKIEK